MPDPPRKKSRNPSPAARRIGLREAAAVVRTREPDTDELLERSAAGDVDARQQVLARHRGRLRRMVAVRLDRRLAPRGAPPAVVQKDLAGRAGKFDGYLATRPFPFYPCLGGMAWGGRGKLSHGTTARKRTGAR